jgi:hypothetical protein
VLSGWTKKDEWAKLFQQQPETRDAAHGILLAAAQIFDEACELEGDGALVLAIREQIDKGEWDF